MKKCFAALTLLAALGCGGAEDATEPATPATETEMPGDSTPADGTEDTGTTEGTGTEEPPAE